ncbi:hypothetical protein GD390_03130 [Campylobacter coli]|nr:hypothetical protein [Campylobacter coli]EIA91978.1 hypothetical protein cco71_03082 [Campylobacter coli 317/04]
MINSWKGFAKLVNEGIFGELKFKDVYLSKDIDFAGAGVIDPVGFSNGFVGNFTVVIIRFLIYKLMLLIKLM